MDGLTAAREIRKRHSSMDDPYIIGASSLMELGNKLYREAGMNDYIAKPFTMSQVDAAIRRFENVTLRGAYA